MRRFWSKLGLELGKHAVIVVVVGVVLTATLAFGATKLKFETDTKSFLNTDDPAYTANTAYQNDFGSGTLVIMFTMDKGYTVDTIDSVANQKLMTELTRKLEAIHGVADVLTPLNALSLSATVVHSPNGNPTDSIAGKILLYASAHASTAQAKAVRDAYTVQTLDRLSKIPAADQNIANPAYVNFLLHDNEGNIRKAAQSFYPNETHARAVLRLGGSLSIAQQSQATASVISAVNSIHFQHATTIATGAPAVLRELNNYLKGGMAKLSGIALLVMLVILLLLFNVRWRLLPLGVVAVGVVWAFGLAGYLHIPLTLATIAGLPVMLGIGIDYAIQLHSRVEEEVLLDRVAHPIQATARNLCPALLIVTFDAVFAFLALQFSKIPLIRQFGTLLDVGIVAICVCSIILPLAILGIREYRSPTKNRRDFSNGRMARLVVRLGSLPTQAAIILAFVAVFAFVGGLFAENHVPIQTDPVDWINPNGQAHHDIEAVQKGLGQTNELDVLIRSSNVFDQKTVGFVNTFENDISTKHAADVRNATGIVATTDYISYVPGAPDVTPSAADVKAVYAAAPESIKRFTATSDQDAMSVVFPTKAPSYDNLTSTLHGIQSYPTPSGVKLTTAGNAAIGVQLLDNLDGQRILLTYLAILFVFLFLTVRLRSIIRALLSMVPVLIAVGLSSLGALALGIKLSPASAVGGPLVVAACTEFTSLILLRFIEERSRGLAPRQAMDNTARRTGRAFVVSALTAIAGVAVISTSSLPLLRDFGIVVAINVTIALLAALVVLPPMLVWADKRNWVSRGMLRPDPDAHELVSQEGAALQQTR